MKRDTLKTILGLVIIGAIVVATFMYGNAQRTAQLNKDKDTKKQATPVTTVTPIPTAVQTAATGGSGTNTAPVKSPSSNSLQGGATPVAAHSGQVAGASTVPDTGGSGNSLPDTGAPEMGLVGLAAIIVAYLMLKRSQRQVVAAARSRRSIG